MSPVELLLEPPGHPASKLNQRALFDDRIPLTAFWDDDVQIVFDRLTALGVEFAEPPQEVPGGTRIVIFNDT